MHPDSGTNYHMSGDRLLFLELSDLAEPIPVLFGNGQRLQSTMHGSIRLTDKVVLSNVLYVPGLTVNLISTSATPWVYEWTITPDKMVLRNRKQKMVYFSAPRINGLYNAVFSRSRIGLVQATRADLVEKLGRNTMGLFGSLRWFKDNTSKLQARYVEGKFLNYVEGSDTSFKISMQEKEGW